MENPSLLDILQLEQIEQDIYRAQLVLAEQYSLYGGQVAAQALLAAGLTVSRERLPHSLPATSCGQATRSGPRYSKCSGTGTAARSRPAG